MLKSVLNVENTAFYSTANAGYAFYAATSLLTIRKQIPNAQLYLFSSGLSDVDRKMLDKNRIIYHELDLGKLFTKTWDYPIDCYYIFAAPEVLLGQGFQYSVYVDGDILCQADPLSDVPAPIAVAGVASAGKEGDFSGIFGDDWKQIKKTWSLPQSVARRQRINSGIVYFNNQRMNDISLLAKAAQLFQRSLELGIPRKGDDSLFSLLQYVYLSENDVAILPPQYNFVLQFNSWEYPIESLVFFHFSIDKPWKVSPYHHDDKGLEVYNPLVKEWRNTYKKIFLLGYYSTENKVYRHLFGLLKRGSEAVLVARRYLRDFIFWVIGYKKSIITRRANTRKISVRLFWWSAEDIGIINFGDEITADLLRSIFGINVIRTSIDQARMVGVGSILDLISSVSSPGRICVWGSGFIEPEKEHTRKIDLDKLVIFALRGKLSMDRLGLTENTVPLGDPGLLASIVYSRSRYVSDKIGVVVHYADLDQEIVKRITMDPRYKVINPLRTPQEVAYEITSCRVILSSSLHGLIFADSFGVPNAHIQFSNDVRGGDYKFRDYYSATGREYGGPLKSDRVFDSGYIDRVMDEYAPPKDAATLKRKLVRSLDLSQIENGN